ARVQDRRARSAAPLVLEPAEPDANALLRREVAVQEVGRSSARDEHVHEAREDEPEERAHDQHLDQGQAALVRDNPPLELRDARHATGRATRSPVGATSGSTGSSGAFSDCSSAALAFAARSFSARSRATRKSCRLLAALAATSRSIVPATTASM